VASTSNLNPETGTLANGSSVTLTVNYKTTLNATLQGKTRSNAAVVMIYAVYYNGSADVSVPLRVTIQDCACCGAYVAANTWKSFMCHNLGADESADPFTPSYAINGAYYQWGRKDEAVPAPTDINGSEPAFTWISATPSGYFGDNTNGENVTVKSKDYDPCPSGYRVPSFSEWDYLRQNNTKTNVGSWTTSKSSINSWAGSKFGEGLMLPAPGRRERSDGALINRAYSGYYWSTRKYIDYAYVMYVTSNPSPSMSYYYHTDGFSVRCIVE
jgi:uncharacterized protein (TIGR02145 family)